MSSSFLTTKQFLNGEFYRNLIAIKKQLLNGGFYQSNSCKKNN